MLEKEFDYYLLNQKSLSETYPGKYIVIVGEDIVGVFPNFEIALYESKKTLQMGSFLIQHCANGSSAYTSTFHSNVYLDNVTD